MDSSAFELFTKVLSSRIQQISQQLELDRKLFTKIREILPSDGSIEFVRHHDYGGAFEIDDHKDLYEFLEHCGRPEFEFFDREMEALRKHLEGSIRQFRDLLGKEVFPVSGFPGRVRVPRDPRQDLEGMAELRSLAKDEKHLQELLPEVLERLQKARNGLNELANQICKAYDNIIRVGRRKLGT